MELTILIAAVVGIIVFAACFLKFAYEGFRHHPVTGLLALIPGINLIALPTLWHKTGKSVMIGAVALVIAAGTWFAGAGQTISNTMNPAAAPSLASANNNAAHTDRTTPSRQAKHLSMLPSKALYRLDFESTSPTNIQSFIGRVVRITNSNLETTDGRVKNVTPSSVFIEQSGAGTVAYEMMLSNIKSVEVMVKRAAR